MNQFHIQITQSIFLPHYVGNTSVLVLGFNEVDIQRCLKTRLL